jgi:leucine-rich repeat protein SHOC2
MEIYTIKHDLAIKQMISSLVRIVIFSSLFFAFLQSTSCNKENDNKYTKVKLSTKESHLKKSTNLQEALKNPLQYDSLIIDKDSTLLLNNGSISKFINLKYLKINGRNNLNLKELFQELAKLKNLKFLELENYFNQALPKEIGKLKNLESLSLSNTDFWVLPEEISELKHLVQLKLIGQTINSVKIPESFKLSNNIKTLIFADSKSTCLPEWIKYMKHIEGLGVYNEKFLKKLPIQISTFNSLRVLEFINTDKLDQNSVFNILSKLPKLTILSLYFPSINHIPENIYLNSELEEIKIFGYNLKTIPKGLLSLPKLKKLLIYDYRERKDNPKNKIILDSLACKGVLIKIVTDKGVQYLTKSGTFSKFNS